MLTSAQCLNQILVQCSQETEKSKSFSSVLALVLEKENPSIISSVERLFSIVSKVEADISSLPYPPDEKKHLNRLFQPFRSILDLSAFSMSMQTAKGNFLKAENLTNLVSIHMALRGFADLAEPSKETLELSTRLRELRLEISEADLPVDLRLSIAERLRQIEAALEKYYAFGADYIEREINELTGEMAFHMIEEPESRSVLSRTLNALGLLRKGIRETRGAVSDIKGIAEFTPAIIEVLGKAGG